MGAANIVLNSAQKQAGANSVVGFSSAAGRAVGPGGIKYKLMPDMETDPGSVVIDHSPARGTWLVTTANAGEAVAYDPGVLFDGWPSVKITIPTVTGATSVFKYTPTNPVSLKQFRSLSFCVKAPICDAAWNIGNNAGLPIQYWLVLTNGKQIRLRFNLTGIRPDGTKVFRWTRDQTASTVVFSSGATGWADVDNATVAYIQVVYSSGSSAPPAGTSFWISCFRLNTGAIPIVSLRFDAAMDGVYVHIKEFLKDNNLLGTFYPVHTMSGGAGYMSLAQLDEMYADGHEIGVHHYDAKGLVGYGMDTTGFPTAASISDDLNAAWAVNRARGWLRGIGLVAEGFSGNYFGGSTDAARQQLVMAGFGAGNVRNLCALNVGWPMLNDPVRWINTPREYIVATQSSQVGVSAASMKAAIDSAINYRQWLIILTHQVVADTATPVGNQMRVSEMLDWLGYLAARVQSGACLCLPVGAALDQIA
jgi:hypothetical protein